SGYVDIDWFRLNDEPGNDVKPSPTPLQTKGDLNGDGKVNSTDYSLLRRHILGINQLEGIALSNADVNGDGNANSTDYALMRRYILGIITSFPE
ncbi:MAG: carbohydrate-binding protein, partial [Clostridiaceae bacterium]|nr:carbohydrate-binding protein [Clostridiaceae bacterium]